MWRAPVLGSVTAEPVTLADAKRQCRIVAADTNFDVELERLIKVARDHVEKRCGMCFAERSSTLACDSFADLASRMPIAPIKSIATIAYVDDDGASQTLGSGVYQQGGTRFEPTIELKPGQSWPQGSSLTVTATTGGDVPEEVVHTILLLVGHWFVTKEAVNIGNIVTPVAMGVDMLLANEIRGLYA